MITITSDDEITILVAKECGFLPSAKFTVNGLPIFERDGKLFAARVAPRDNADWLPKYATSLDAMAVALATLNEQEWHSYCVILPLEIWPLGWKDWRDTKAILSLSARHQAVAFLKAKGVET